MLDRLTIERIDACAGGSPIIVALSGGGDSTALLHLLVAHYGAQRLRALVVDHALRDGSASDAARAAGFAKARGVEAEILTLAWPDGPRRSQEAARDARYAVLSERARQLGANVIAVAHNADDQAETLTMRAAAGSGWRGLAGMAAFAPAPVWPEGRGVWIARPLLDVRRETLREYLRGRGAEWIEDPANANTAFERVRVRAELAAREAAGENVLTPLLQQAKAHRARAEEVDTKAWRLIQAAAQFDGEVVAIDLAVWRAEDDVRQRALSALIAAVAGAAREPPLGSVAQLEAQVSEDGFRGATLGGTMLSLRRGVVWIRRDSGATEGRAGVSSIAPMPLVVGAEMVWDGRLLVCAPDAGWEVIQHAGRAALKHGNLAIEPGEVRWAHWLLPARAAHALGVESTAAATQSPSINDKA